MTNPPIPVRPQTPGKDQRGLVSVKEQDFLEQDAPIRGQKYAVVSFVSPEDILKSKEVFAIGEFMTSLAGDVETLFRGMLDRYKEDPVTTGLIGGLRERYGYLWSVDLMQAEFNAFARTNEAKIHADFSALEGSTRTSIRGLKIRGVYESEVEARHRIKAIQIKDPLFDVYMMEVGCWCPWNPNPDAVGDSEYNETMLNTLVKGYKDNSIQRDAMYESRKSEMIDRIGKENDVWEQRRKEGASSLAAEVSGETVMVSDVTNVLPITMDSEAGVGAQSVASSGEAEGPTRSDVAT